MKGALLPRARPYDLLFRRLYSLVRKGFEVEDLWSLELDVPGAEARLHAGLRASFFQAFRLISTHFA